MNKYEKAAVSRARIRLRLKQRCGCVRFGGQCMQQFDEGIISQLRDVFHTLEDVGKSFLIQSMREDQPGDRSERPAAGAGLRAYSSYSLLGHRVCKPAFWRLLGISFQMEQALVSYSGAI